MNKKLIAIALICGLACALCVFAFMGIVQQQAQSARSAAADSDGVDQVSVLVASRDLYPGDTVTTANTKMQSWASNLLPDGAVTVQRDALGKKLTSLVLAGEVVSERRFTEESGEIEVPDGMVAVSVPTKDVRSVGGALKAGEKVDVYGVGTTTSCLARNVLILSTSVSSEEGSSNTEIEWVTIAVEPSQVEQMVASSKSLDIYLTLPSESASNEVAQASSLEAVQGSETTSSSYSDATAATSNTTETK